MNNWCKDAHDKMSKIREHQRNGMKLSDDMAMDLVVYSSACKIMEMDDYWRGYHEEMSGHSDNVDHHNSFNVKTATDWVDKMKNEDGTVGEHWSMDETSAVASQIVLQFGTISEYCFWVAMNMYYSDSFLELKKYHAMIGVSPPTPQQVAIFCGLMAQSFLSDKDSIPPKEKMAVYYNDIVAN